MGKIKKDAIEELQSRIDSIKTKVGNTGSTGILPMLTVAFITVLKLCGVISWSWVWVLAPFWIPIILAIMLLLLVVILTAKKSLK